MSIGYQPNGTFYTHYIDQRHDHLCTCPGCNGDLNEEDWIQAVSRDMARRAVDEEPDRWIPVIPVGDLIHTDDYPYCDDPACGCHILFDNLESFHQYIEQPLQDGLLTTDEAHRLYWGKQI